MKHTKTSFFFWLIMSLSLGSLTPMSLAIGEENQQNTNKNQIADKEQEPTTRNSNSTPTAMNSANTSKEAESTKFTPRTKKQKKKNKKRHEPRIRKRKTRVKLLPATRKVIHAANSGFKRCQKRTVRLMKANQVTPRQFKIQINSCRERYPGAGLYVKCKKRVLKKFGRSKKAKLKLKRCKRLLLAASFNREESLPFFLHRNKVYFAGVGFNKSQKVEDFSLPGFDCSKLKPQIDFPELAEHILFGNHPVWFSKLRGKSKKSIRQLLNFTARVADNDAQEGKNVPGFGKVFGDPASNDATVYFPSANCIYSEELGDIFTGLSAYYLLDKKNRTVTPFFSIAFYKPGITGQGIKTSVIVKKMSKILGKKYSVIYRSKAHTVLATKSIRSFDDEGDPRNVCRTPRQHSKIAIIKNRSGAPSEPEFVLLANIKSLCHYGDRASRRL